MIARFTGLDLDTGKLAHDFSVFFTDKVHRLPTVSAQSCAS